MMTNGANLKPREFSRSSIAPAPPDTPSGQVNGGLPFGSPMDVVQDGPE